MNIRIIEKNMINTMWGALKLQVLENASMVKQKYKKAKCVTVENTSTEKSSTIVQGRKMQVRKKQVRVNRASIIALIQYYTTSWVG